MKDIYKNIKVAVLASTYETCGMVNLEAGLAGCNVVTSDLDATREYCKDFVEYFDPNNIEDIKLKVTKAYNKDINFEFQDFILENYKWSDYVQKHIEIYKEIANEN